MFNYNKDYLDQETKITILRYFSTISEEKEDKQIEDFSIIGNYYKAF